MLIARRRLSTLSWFYAYLVARGDTRVMINPVPEGLATRSRGGAAKTCTAPLVRVPRTLPKILSPVEVDALVGALRTWRDRAMVEAMLLGGLRRCEVLGLRLADIHIADRRVFVADGKGGHQRWTPMANRFFATLGHYLHEERPVTGSHVRLPVHPNPPPIGCRRPATHDVIDDRPTRESVLP